MPEFIPGLTLGKLFYQQEVKQILAREFPKLRYSVAIIGWGSEVLGFDTSESRDHHWGPRMLLFLAEKDFPKLKHKISRALSNNLPYEFMGYSTNYSEPEPNGVRHPINITDGPVNHMVNIYTVRSFVEARIGVDPFKKIALTDWLTFPQQRLLELVSGAVYHDGLGDLRVVRRKLEYYPRDVWLYMLAAQWTRISQEEAFVGRTAVVGDELGSQVIAARMVREIMRLALMMQKQYVPYSKWLGTAFSRLKIAKELSPILRKALLAQPWKQREKWLSNAYSVVARHHNSLRITKALPTSVSHYFGRPYLVIHADTFAAEIKKAIKHREVKGIKPDIGCIDQFTDSTDLIQDLDLCKSLRVVYKSS